MQYKIFAAFLLPALAVSAMPAKRDDVPRPNLDTADAAAHASLYSSQASALLSAVSDEIKAAGPSGTAYTAYITTIAGRPVVEMSSIGGEAFVAMTSSTADPSSSATAGAVKNAESAAADSTAASATSTASTDSTSSTDTQSPASTDKTNAAMGLTVSRPLLTGVVSALGAVGAGAMMLL